MKRLSIKGITRGRGQFIPDEEALNGLDKSWREGDIIWPHSDKKKKNKTVAQAYFIPLRAKVSFHPPPANLSKSVQSLVWA